MKILMAALISEGILALASLAIYYVFSMPLVWNASNIALAQGLFLTVPPLIINKLLWSYSESHPDSIFGRFSREIIIPLCRHITPTIAIIVAILSGVCEELFFRGAINSLCLKITGPVFALIFTSFIFAATHFIGNFKRYGAMIPLYTTMGAYLWLVHYYTDSLTAVAVCHGVYNLVVIVMVRQANIARA